MNEDFTKEQEAFINHLIENADFDKNINALVKLQEAWEDLWGAVVNAQLSELRCELVFQIAEGMSWESVRNLNKMHKTINAIIAIIKNQNFDEEIEECLEDLKIAFYETLARIGQGEDI